MGSSSSSGAFGVGHYRDVLNINRLPCLSSLTYEGLMKEYFYQTGIQHSNKLLEGAYSIAIDKDPITLEKQVHLAIGLHSCKDGKYERRDLNLVIVLDISGSMGSGLSVGSSKIQVANQVICEIIDNMSEFERLGIVLFDDTATTLLPLTIVKDLDKSSLKNQVLSIKQRGGTNFEAGMKQGIELYSSLDLSNMSNSNRIIYLTDACPTIGRTDSLDVLTKDAYISPYKINSTFIGVGLDFNSEIIEELTRVGSCNYFSVHSNDEFKKILNEDFNYIVTPICYNVKLNISQDGWKIEKCFGNNLADESTGEIMKVNSCCASQLDERGVKGGIILLRLKNQDECQVSNVKLTLSYEDENGKKFKDEKEITINGSIDQESYYETNGVRKAVALVRYIEIVRGYISEMEKRKDNSSTFSEEWNSKLEELLKVFKLEINEIGDEEMNKEIDAISKFIEFSQQQTPPTPQETIQTP